MEHENIETEIVKPPEPFQENTTVCTNCQTVNANEPTTDEYIHLTEEARLKVLRTMKMAFTHRNSIGLCSDEALQILMTGAERIEDKFLLLLRCKDFNKYTKNHGFYPWLDEKISHIEHEHKPDRPKQK